jgi:predicted transcriptional regulator
MSCVELIHKLGPMVATEIAERMGRPIETVYMELVAAEAKGVVRIQPRSAKRGQAPHCEWWPAHPEFTPEYHR